MIRPVRGALIILSCGLLGGCFAPMTTREAQGIANARLAKFCNNRCGKVSFGRTQRINDRWLVDFDGPRHKFTVTVEKDGNSKVDVWNK
ncbi:MAG TPA: hypothetical protein VFQ69_04490 [Rhizomicrobium sp.]|nr:hypothetical protein [Rhizomicrobium sp.]